ncbi:hypothetical protein PG993_014814 [Apiospora rasikravindrae]|uniref:Uncharacterized protein n=1 Tax=Apiospora rasikravindrae TaxID=990691 RepID=A0ABR1RQA4_9PEZI
MVSLPPHDAVPALVDPLPDEPLGAGVEVQPGGFVPVEHPAALEMGVPGEGSEPRNVLFRKVHEVLEAGRVVEAGDTRSRDSEFPLVDELAASQAGAEVFLMEHWIGLYLDEEEVRRLQCLAEAHS